MLLREFPYARPAARPPDYRFGREHVVVRAQSRAIAFGEHTAPLSVKATLQGLEHYRVNGRVMTVAPDRFLVLSQDQPYASYIDSDDEAVDSLCVFFADKAARSAWTDTQYDDFALIDRGADNIYAPILRPQMCAYDRAITPLFARLAAASHWRTESALALDEACSAILSHFAQQSTAPAKEPDRWRAKLARQETIRRLRIVRDYMHENFEHDLRLENLAALAGLSPHYFLRRFTECFNASPYAYLVKLRMAAAQHLLTVTTLPVSQIALSVGYGDFSAFARRFRRHFGCSPSIHRSRTQ